MSTVLQDKKKGLWGYKKNHNQKVMSIYIIQMAEELQKRLDCASKLGRDELRLGKLIAYGGG